MTDKGRRAKITKEKLWEREKRKWERNKEGAGNSKCWVQLLCVINTIGIQFSSHGKLRLWPFAANITKVNQSSSELVRISLASSLLFWDLCLKISSGLWETVLLLILRVKTLAPWESDGYGRPGLQIEGRYLRGDTCRRISGFNRG